MTRSIVTDLFLYFAKYPALAGVKSMFVKGASDNQAYSQLYDAVGSMEQHSLNPELGSYVFGVSFEAVQARIKNITGPYLFIDYGQAESRKTDLVRRDSISVAVTVAFRLREFSNDLIEHTIAADQTITYLMDIRDRMLAEQKEKYFLKGLSESHTIVPFSSAELQSTGWTMVFETEGVDFLTGRRLSFTQ